MNGKEYFKLYLDYYLHNMTYFQFFEKILKPSYNQQHQTGMSDVPLSVTLQYFEEVVYNELTRSVGQNELYHNNVENNLNDVYLWLYNEFTLQTNHPNDDNNIDDSYTNTYNILYTWSEDIDYYMYVDQVSRNILAPLIDDILYISGSNNPVKITRYEGNKIYIITAALDMCGIGKTISNESLIENTQKYLYKFISVMMRYWLLNYLRLIPDDMRILYD